MQKLNNVLIGKYRHERVRFENQPSALYWNDSYRSDDVNTTTAYTQNYSYDLMGNIDELQHTGDSNFTRTYNHTDNLLESFEVGSNTYYYQYDACGNQIKENEERHMQWDYGDKMRLFYNQTSTGTEPSVYTHYLYDAGGNRVKKLNRTEGGNWETITYIDGIIEYREDQDSNLQSISHVMDDSKRIATIREGSDFGDSTPAIKYNLDDHLGSSNVLVDENGTLVNFEEYYPFGETSFGAYSKKRYRFCGKEKDEESGLYYYGARYYAPWLCRFISVDPLAGKYPFYTPFQYAGNKPIISIDIDGLEGSNDTGQQNNNPSDSTSAPAPSPAPTPNDTAGTNINCHVVQSGETLGGIAKKHGTSVANLKKDNPQLNEQKDTDLAVGTELDVLPHKQPADTQKTIHTTPMLKNSPLQTFENMVYSKWKSILADSQQKPSQRKSSGQEGAKAQVAQNTEGTPWMDTALQEYNAGVKEDPLKPNSGLRVDEYLKYAGASSPNAWCAAFVNWCLGQNGIKGAGATGENYLNWGIKIEKPIYGAVVIFKTGHVGFYMGTNSDGTLKILHGNWSNRVKISSGVKDPISPSDIKAYRIPNR